MKGKIAGWGDSTLVIKEKRTGNEHQLHLGKTKSFKWLHKARLVAAKVLLILAGINYGFVMVLFIAALFGDLGIGTLLLVLGMKKIEPRKWKWRRLRKVIVRKSAS